MPETDSPKITDILRTDGEYIVFTDNNTAFSVKSGGIIGNNAYLVRQSETQEGIELLAAKIYSPCLRSSLQEWLEENTLKGTKSVRPTVNIRLKILEHS